MRTSWLVFQYEADFQLDPGGPTWAQLVLREIQLPRWGYEIHDKGWAVFLRTEQRTTEGNAYARLRLLPTMPRPEVRLDIYLEGKWGDNDERRTPAPAMANIREEAEALLVLLGCRSPSFKFVGTERRR